MNSNIGVAAQQLSSDETGNRQSDRHQPHLISKRSAENAREALVLFPAGRFFRFPVRVRIRIACESQIEGPFPGLNVPDLNPTIEQMRSEVGAIVFALIENASCVDAAKALPEIFLFGDVVVDFRKMDLHRDGKQIEATAREFKMLRYFVTHPEVPISRDELLNYIWGSDYCPTTRTVDNWIVDLRKKLENDPARPAHFLTVRGVGYKFVP